MREVTASNFEELYPEICKSIKDSKFLSFDAEFSGISSNEESRLSLFDTVEERYVKLKNNIEKCVAIQFGLTTFDHDRETNKYMAQSFNFYLFPKVVPSRDAVVQFHASAIEFLTTHGFDFNKFAYEGISYLNEEEEQELRLKVADDSMLSRIERGVSYTGEDELRSSHGRASEWLKTSVPGDAMSLEASSSKTIEYLLQKELRARYPEIWTELRSGKIVLLRVDKELRKMLEEREGDKLETALVDHYVGFSNLFKLMVSLKKVIVGHNVLLDLMFVHQQFYKRLPSKYAQFKNNVSRLFPTIYDTKHISYDLKKMIKKEETWKSNSLKDLYDFFDSGYGRYLNLNSPMIELEKNGAVETRKFHEAGWDSYCTGYCFIKMSHMLAASRYGGSAEFRPLTNTEILSGPKDHANRVNLIRASINYVNFAGTDPVGERPQWLHVRSLKSNSINVAQIADMFSTYGPVDVKRFARRQALVAVSNHRSARDILTRFRTSRDIHVAPYSLLRHSPAVKILLWGGVLISGGTLAWILRGNLQKPTIV